MSDEARAAVAYIERDSDHRILCVWNKRYGGWGMPGGKVEDNETVVQALARELGEETGLSIAGQPEAIYDAPHRTKPIPGVSGRGSRVLVFRVWARGEPKEMEPGCPVTWLTREEFLRWSPFRDFYELMFETIFPPECSCAEIQRQDPKRHFKGCALRVEIAEARCCCAKIHFPSGEVFGNPCPACPLHGDNAVHAAQLGQRLTGGGPLTYPDGSLVEGPRCTCPQLADGSDRITNSGCPVHASTVAVTEGFQERKPNG